MHVNADDQDNWNRFYLVEAIHEDDLIYKKFSDGSVEVVGKVNLGVVDVDNSVGTFYRSGNVDVVVNLNIVKSIHSYNLMPVNPTSYNYWVASGVTSNPEPSVRIFSATSRTGSVIVLGMHLIGRWK